MINMKIVLGVGIGDLLFGLTEAQAEEILGLADRSYITDSDCRRVQFNEVSHLTLCRSGRNVEI